MKEFADRPLRVPQEPLALHLWRMTHWLLELRLVPRLTERRGGWRAPLRALRDGLTATGVAVLLASVLLLLLARRSNPGFDLGLATAGLLMLALSAAVGRLWRPRLHLVRLSHEVAVAGQPCRSRVRLTNTGRRPARELMLREWRGPGWRPAGASKSALIDRLDAGQTQLCEVAVMPSARGLLHLPGLAVHSFFPLFLTRSTVSVALPLELPVLPPPLPVSLPPLRELAAQCLKTGVHVARSAGALEYAHTRPYQVGDPSTRLDHRASARRGELMSRVFRGGSELHAEGTAICCDTAVAGFAPWQRRPRDAAALDRRLALVLELVAHARAEALPLKALALGVDWQPMADEAALHRAVATCPPTRHAHLPASLPEAGLLYLLVTEDAGDAITAQVAAWRAAGHLVLAFRLAGRGGRALPAAPGNHELAA
jgi:uncharacterized protein (DUF58 family)